MQNTHYLPIVGAGYATQPIFKVVKMEFTDAGTYNQQFMRTFETLVDKDVMQKFQMLVDGHQNTASIHSAAASGVANSFMKISASPSAVVNIPHGWQEKRLRFRLIVEEQNNLTGMQRIRHIFQGFSEAHGVSMSGFLDPKMNLYINSFMRIMRDQWQDPITGHLSVRDRILESGQIMEPHLLKSSVGANVHMMRPSDIMAYSGGDYAMNYARSTVGNMGMLIDGRTSISNTGMFNARANNVSVDYVTNTLNAIKVAKAYEEFGADNSGVFDRAFSKLYDGSSTSNSFLIALGGQLGIAGAISRLTLETLKAIDMTFNAPEYNMMVGLALNGMHRSGQTENWNTPNLLTQAAAIIANTVPAIATDLLLHSIEFTATNSTIGGVEDMRIINVNSTSGNAIDIPRYTVMFIDRIKSELTPSISMNNMLTYAIKVQYNVFDDIRISISLDGSPLVDYAMPVFCDAIMTPVVAPNASYMQKITSDIEQLVSNIDFSQYTSDSSTGFNMSVPSFV